MYDILIHNGVIVTVNPGMEIIEDGIICVSGETAARVEARGDDAPLPEAKTTIDANRGIILPGFVNAHTHLPMTLFRGLADDLPLMEWLNDHVFPAEANHVKPGNVRMGAMLGCAELALSGVTTCCDGYFLEDEVASAVEEFGLRGVLAQGVIDFPAPGVPDPGQNISAAADYADRWLGKCGRITPSIFCHSPYTCSSRTLKAAKAAASERGLVFQIHAAETKSERDQITSEHGVSPIQYLDRLGLLDEKTLLVHCVWVDDADMKLMADRGANAAHCPESNMKLGAGVAPIPTMMAGGVPVGLGTDGCASNNDMDLLREMDVAAKLHKAIALDPTVMSAEEVLKMATINGARAIGLDKIIGSLEPGKQADVIIIDARKPHLTPMYNPVSHVVYAAAGSDVRDVIAAGRILVRNRTLPRVDLDDIIDRVVEIGREVGGKARER
ncbi:MAG: amidohydrolase [Desulfobacterales bacterium]|nr:amidohydrolase [Desulfobacterales bacterium]